MSCLIDAMQVDLVSQYQLHLCSQWINQQQITRIALQFNKKDLKDSPQVVRWLKAAHPSLDLELFVVLTASCGVDFLAPQRLGPGYVQGIICFGASCIYSNTQQYTQVPVLYSFGCKFDQDTVTFLQSEIAKQANDSFLILYDLEHIQLVHFLLQQNAQLAKNIGTVISTSPIHSFAGIPPEMVVSSSTYSIGAFAIERQINEYKSVIWIGSPPSIEYRVGLQQDILCIAPNSLEVSTIVRSKEVTKRLALIQRVKTCYTIGILLTNCISDVTSIINRISSRAAKKGKKVLLISFIQAVDDSKFGNFGEVDAFAVASACQCQSLIMNFKCHVPLISLTELEIALGVQMEYGGILWNQDDDTHEDLTPSSPPVQSSLMEYRDNMKGTWYGLQVDAGEQPASILKEGTSGLPRGYESEPVVTFTSNSRDQQQRK